MDEVHYGNDVPMTVGVDWSMEKEGAQKEGASLNLKNNQSEDMAHNGNRLRYSESEVAYFIDNTWSKSVGAYNTPKLCFYPNIGVHKVKCV